MPPSLSRSNPEAHMYMDMHPCECGEMEFDRTSSFGRDDDGSWLCEYAGACERCGAARSFVFRVTEEVPVLPEHAWSDLKRPSELLDPGQWLWIADGFSNHPADTEGLSVAELRQRRDDLALAASAIDEVLLFGSPEAEHVPAELIRSELGRTVYEAEPGRFRRVRLEAVRDVYRQLAGVSRTALTPRPIEVRSFREANLYMDLQVCSCGDNEFDRDDFGIDSVDGKTVVTYEGPCNGCGHIRAFWFSAPNRIESHGPLEYHFSYPQDPPSTVIDAGQWAAAAQLYAALADQIGGMEPERAWIDLDEWEEMVDLLGGAVAAWDEVLKFIPPPSGRVPAEALWTAQGRNVHRADPAALAKDHIVAERAARQRRLTEFIARNPEPEPEPEPAPEDG